MSRQRKGGLESVHTRVRKCHHLPGCKMRNAAVTEQESSSLSDVRCPDLGLLLAALLLVAVVLNSSSLARRGVPVKRFASGQDWPQSTLRHLNCCVLFPGGTYHRPVPPAEAAFPLLCQRRLSQALGSLEDTEMLHQQIQDVPAQNDEPRPRSLIPRLLGRRHASPLTDIFIHSNPVFCHAKSSKSSVIPQS